MSRDISNNTVAVLLVLVIAVSVLGTFAFVKEFEPVDHRFQQDAQARVSLEIGDAPQQQQPSSATGNAVVALKIAAAEEN